MAARLGVGLPRFPISGAARRKQSDFLPRKQYFIIGEQLQIAIDFANCTEEAQPQFKCYWLPIEPQARLI
jgi:hypothetical protein